jgi:Polyketide cyclase / dehydrase and lipid transport
VSTWQLRAPIEQVWTALTDLEHLPSWYASVQEARELTPGDAQGIGRQVRYVIKGACPAAGVRGHDHPLGCSAGPGAASPRS